MYPEYGDIDVIFIPLLKCATTHGQKYTRKYAPTTTSEWSGSVIDYADCVYGAVIIYQGGELHKL